MSILDIFRPTPKARRAKVKRARRFDAGITNNLVAWLSGVVTGGINTDLKADLALMVARSRELAQNEPMAKRYLSLLTANVIGSKGITYQSKVLEDATPSKREPLPDVAANEALESAWKRFLQPGVVDPLGGQSGRGLMCTILKTVARDGNAFLQEDLNAKNEFGYALRLLDGTRLATDINEPRDVNGVAVTMGVETGPDGERLAYYFYDGHSGVLGINRKKRRIPADVLIHIFHQDYPEQILGYPWLHASMSRMRTLKKFQECALVASAVGASKMGFYTQSPDMAADSNPSIDAEDADGPIQEATAAHFEVLDPGMGFEAFDPEYPHALYGSFTKTAKRDIASGLDVSYHSLASDLEGVNFSSIRSGTLEDREQYKILQEWFIEQFLERVFSRWLNMGLLNSSIKHPGTGNALPAAKREKFSRHIFIGRRWDWVDPLKDEQANGTALNNLMDSPYRILTQKGLDPDEVLDDLARFQRAAEARGINPGYIAQVMQAAPTQPEGEDNAETDE